MITSFIAKINGYVNDFVWGVPAMALILGVGLFLTVRLKAPQVRYFVRSMKETLGRMFRKKEVEAGAISPFQALCTALSATVGTGNIAGVAGAIALGGPGAVFWMWISALLGMCTKFSEVVLAVHFREKNADGEYVGGPMYNVKNGLPKNLHFLAYLYAFLGLLTVFGTGNATQVNAITGSIGLCLKNFNLLPADGELVFRWIIGISIAIILALILIGGIKRIGKAAETLVPFMALLYIILALGVVVLHIDKVPAVFASIIEGAFNPRAITGGAVGTMFMAMKKGVSRGIFSNEAGLGTGSIAHACSDTKEPVEQGLYGIFEVFTDTIIICTLTALVVLISGEVMFGAPAGAELTLGGFASVYGPWVSILTAIAMSCFAFTTILGWGLFGKRFTEFLFGRKYVNVFLAIFSLVAILGATMDLGLLWDLADTFNGMMAIPNLISLLLLSGVVVKIVKDYFHKKTI